MAEKPKGFGRRAPPKPAPAATPTASGSRKRTVAVSLIAAGALAAAGAHFAGSHAATCRPIEDRATDGAFGPSGDAAACPPGTTRTSSGYSGGWHIGRALNLFSWSSSSGRAPIAAPAGTSSVSPSIATSRPISAPAATAVPRGGFGSLGAFHFSGGS